MGISDEFRKYGAKLKNTFWSVSAENDKGELVVSLWHQYFEKPVGKTIKYIDRVSRWSGNGNIEFRERIEKAYNSKQVVRAVIARTDNEMGVEKGEDASNFKNTFHSREDWIGQVTHWDGDNFHILFTSE
jgi:hypothetical protein